MVSNTFCTDCKRQASIFVKIAISTRVDAETARKLRAQGERGGITLGAVIDEMAKKLQEAE